VNIQSPHNNPQRIEQRIRTLRTLWAALLMSIILYYVLTLFIGEARNAQPNNAASLVLLVVGLSATLLSFLIKGRFLKQSVERQQLQLVQTGYIVTWAITEVAALLGLLDFFLTGNRYYFLLFIIAAGVQLLHFPKKQHVVDAAFTARS